MSFDDKKFKGLELLTSHEYFDMTVASIARLTTVPISHDLHDIS